MAAALMNSLVYQVRLTDDYKGNRRLKATELDGSSNLQAPMCRFDMLKRLNLRRCSLQEADMRNLLCPRLRNLVLFNIVLTRPALGEQGLSNFVGELAVMCPNLEILQLSNSAGEASNYDTRGLGKGVTSANAFMARDDNEIMKLSALPLRDLSLRLAGSVSAAGMSHLADLHNLSRLELTVGE